MLLFRLGRETILLLLHEKSPSEFKTEEEKVFGRRNYQGMPMIALWY